jgi:hypothetical protein
MTAMRPWVLAVTAVLTVPGCGLVVGSGDDAPPSSSAASSTTSGATTLVTLPTKVTVVGSSSTTATPTSTAAAPTPPPSLLARGPFGSGWKDAGPFPVGPNDATTSTVPNWCGRNPGAPAPTSTATTAWRQTDGGPATLLVRAERYGAGGGAGRLAAVTGVTLPCTWTDTDGKRFTADSTVGPNTGGGQVLVKVTDRAAGTWWTIVVLQQGDDVLILALDSSESGRLDATVAAAAARLRGRTG